ncbi:biotin--[acetyl-CoA-carboxylase] ligase [Thiomonas sp. FB-Cd]|uniref:biotin--[acetyl-CoA-carboxylase] ligase n=1 Tax=Thiomonas sp. FB-Cd TaxID=1158292 RepID=UPI0006916C19|nr:biotin--[acetyl-CoA-carboxylase] ligase [Thiomonas sp. FB-Cd]
MRSDTFHSIDAQKAQTLEGQLAAQNLACSVRWMEQTTSTNADLLQRVRAGGGALSPQLLVVGHQTAGRGRQARVWQDAGNSLLTSLAWPFAPGAAIAGLSVAVGVWLTQSLRGLGSREARLKWPNDVLLHGRKVAGVLVELADTPQARWAVIGIGLNLRTPPDMPHATGLDAIGSNPPDRWEVLHKLAPALLAGLPIFAQSGLAPWIDAWNHLHAWTGQAVAVLDQGETRHTGIALGVDDSGCLLLETPQGLRRVSSGDVSLRLAGAGAGASLGSP